MSDPKTLNYSVLDEHPLEFHDVYREYLSRFEGKIERFIVSEGYDPLAFYAECKDILENGDVFGTKRFFVEALLATSEYDSFFMLMKGEMEKYRSSGK